MSDDRNQNSEVGPVFALQSSLSATTRHVELRRGPMRKWEVGPVFPLRATTGQDAAASMWRVAFINTRGQFIGFRFRVFRLRRTSGLKSGQLLKEKTDDRRILRTFSIERPTLQADFQHRTSNDDDASLDRL